MRQAAAAGMRRRRRVDACAAHGQVDGEIRGSAARCPDRDRVRAMPTGPDSRVAALDGLLEEAHLDAVLATKDASIAYLTGFWGLQLERFFAVAVRRGGAGALIAPSLDRDSVGRAPTPLTKALYDAAQSNGLPTLFDTLDGAR